MHSALQYNSSNSWMEIRLMMASSSSVIIERARQVISLKLIRKLRSRYLKLGFPIRVIIVTLVASSFIIAIVHFLYKIPAVAPFLESSWSAGELLNYLGSIVASFATIIAVYMTICDNKEQLELSQRNALMPNLIPYLWHNYNGQVKEFPPDADCVFIFESPDGGVFYYDVLDSTQNAQMFGRDEPCTYDVPTNIVGLKVSISNPWSSTAIKITNVGSGLAINVGICMRRASLSCNLTEQERYAPIPPLAVGDNVYIGIVFLDGKNIKEEYELTCRYFDAQNNQYIQTHRLQLNKGRLTIAVDSCGELVNSAVH